MVIQNDRILRRTRQNQIWVKDLPVFHFNLSSFLIILDILVETDTVIFWKNLSEINIQTKIKCFETVQGYPHIFKQSQRKSYGASIGCLH